MEYFLGSALTLIILFVVAQQIRKDNNASVKLQIRRSQSYIYSFLFPEYSGHNNFLKPSLNTQATANLKKKEVKVIFYEDQAYWIANGTLVTANIVDGQIDRNSTKGVDTMGVDKVELNKLSIIVEKLTEESVDDNRNSGNEELF